MTRAIVSNEQTVSYSYDAVGRRTSRSVDSVTTSFLYDGVDVVLDRAGNGAETDYLNGDSIDDKLRQESEASGQLFFLKDHLGSTAALTDAGGNVVERMQYEPFGGSAGGALTRYGFSGREKDEETGLIYYRARWYDPAQGRFITEDPLGFDGNDTNLYRYGGNDPINLIDPLGLSTIVVFVSSRKSRQDQGHAYVVLQDKCGERVPVCGADTNAEALFEGRAAGVAGPGRKVRNGDTPFGIYEYNDTQGGRAGSRLGAAYGTGKVIITPLYGDALDAKQQRSDIRIHGGGSGLRRRGQNPYGPTHDLLETQGCVRLQNRDIDSLIGAIKGLPGDDPLEYVFVGDNTYLNNLATRTDLPANLRDAQRQLRIALGLARPEDRP